MTDHTSCIHLISHHSKRRLGSDRTLICRPSSINLLSTDPLWGSGVTHSGKSLAHEKFIISPLLRTWLPVRRKRAFYLDKSMLSGTQHHLGENWHGPHDSWPSQAVQVLSKRGLSSVGLGPFCSIWTGQNRLPDTVRQRTTAWDVAISATVVALASLV